MIKRNRNFKSIEIFIYSIIAVTILWRWILYSMRSFWIDELATIAMVENSLYQTIQNTLTLLFSSWAYTPLLWIFMKFSTDELFLRSFSIGAVLCSLYIIYRSYQFLRIPHNVAFRAIVISMLFFNIQMAACNVRPYSIAMLALSLSYAAFFQILYNRSSVTKSIVYIFSTILVPYLHPMYVLSLLPQVCFLPEIFKYSKTKIFFSNIVAILIICSPALIIFNTIVGNKYLVPLYIENYFFNVLVPAEYMIGIGLMLITLLVLRICKKSSFLRLGESGYWKFDAYVAFLGWIPHSILWLIQTYGHTSVLFNRYIPFSSICFSLTIAIFLERFKSRLIKSVLLGVLLYGFFFHTSTEASKSNDDWQTAIKRSHDELQRYNTGIKPTNTAIFLACQAVESTSEQFIRDPKKYRFLASPLMVYPLEGEIKFLPLTVGALKEMPSYEDELLHSSFGIFSYISLIAKEGDTQILQWFLEKCRSHNYNINFSDNHANISTALCVKRHDTIK